MDAFLKWIRADWDRVLGFTLIAMGALLVVLGYFGASDSPYVDQAVSYLISGGVGGLFLLGVGATLLISADLHDEWRKLDRVENVLRTFNSTAVETTGGVDVDVRSQTGGDGRGTAANGAGTEQRSSQVIAMVAAGGLRPSPAGVPATLPRLRPLTIGLALSLVMIALGWNQAATHAQLGQAVDGLVIAGVGLSVAGLVGAVVTLFTKRSVQLRKSWLFAPFSLAELVAQRIGTTQPSATASNSRVLVADGLTHYHDSGCPALAGVPAREIDHGRLPAGLKPCPICEVS